MSTNPDPPSRVTGAPAIEGSYENVMTRVRNLASTVNVEGPRLSGHELACALYSVRTVHALLLRNVNALCCPLNKLPPELLTMVFSYCVAPGLSDWVWIDVALPITPRRTIDPMTFQLLRLIRVCRLWRQVILNMPVFWTSIDHRRRDMVDTFLRLSGSLPISLFFCPEDWCLCNSRVNSSQYDKVAHLYRILQVHGPRLRRLDLGVCLNPGDVARLLNFRAPHLQCLTISTNMVLGPHLSARLMRVKLFAGDADALKALAILPRISWIPTNYFPNLTHFCCRLNWSQPQAHAHDFLFLLSNMPRLEHMFLESIRETTYTGTWTPPLTPIELLHLRSIVFGGRCSYESALTVLHALALPPDVFIRLNEAHVREADIARLHLDVLRQPFASVDIILSDVLDLLLVALSDTAGGFWLRAALEDDPDPDLNTDPDAAGGWPRWLAALPAQLDLAHTTALRVRLDAGHAFWPAVLAAAVRLEELNVALGHPAAPPAPLPAGVLCAALAQEPLLCSVLHTLRIEWPVPGAPDDMCMCLCVPRIAEMLATRERLGARRLDTLALRMPATPELAERTVGGTDVLRGLVGACECVVGADEHVFGFEVGDAWCEVEGDAEKYWRKEGATHPAYRLDELGLGGFQ